MIRIITILFLFVSLHAGAQHGMLLAKPAAAEGTSYLLDTYTGAAAAYAMNRLNSAYSGSCIRVRRASDSAEQDIGFSGGDLDESSLSSFCSGTDCFVTTWYDQSGNGRNATESTAARQPKIVSSGTVIRENSAPAIQFTRSDSTRLATADIAIGSAYLSIFSTAATSSNVIQEFTMAGENALYKRRGHFIWNGGAGTTWYRYATAFGSNLQLATNSGQMLQSSFFDNASDQISGAVNGGSLVGPSSFTLSDPADAPIKIGYAKIGGPVTEQEFLNGNVQVVIYYLSDQSANRTGIESIINTYYSIY